MKKKLYHQFACSCLMLPEHRARLARHRREKTGDTCGGEPGCTDEQQLEQFQRLLEQSLHEGLRLKVIYIDSAGRHILTGVFIGLAGGPGRIRFQPSGGGRSITLAASGIVHLEAAPPPGFLQ